ncbi:MAG TPA: hypothetical protein VN832_08325 [Stellaceae bacterium]|nr:hypothetical protein [Stellaceae bacterium]
MAIRQLSITLGAVLLVCTGCIVAPPPLPPPMAATAVPTTTAAPNAYPYYPYSPYYSYYPYYDYPWFVGPDITIGLGGWDGWYGRGRGRGGFGRR